jgi:DNA-directed RNA polymerase subunit RPC12/RpoP
MGEASYVCPNCGEEIVVPLDASAGRDQEYGEDCPVCCSPNLLRVRLEPDGSATIDAQPD